MDGAFLTTLPALIKINIFLLLWLILWSPLGIILARRLAWNPRKSATPAQKLPLVASLYAVAPLIIWGVLTLESVPLADYGLAWQSNLAKSLGIGILIAVAGLGIMFLLEWALGWVTWKPENLDRVLSLALPLLILGLWVGITEELIFRGLFFTQLSQDYAPLLAAGISSLIFALLHLIWERKETLPQIPGLWLMGMVLAWARVIDNGSLGLAWGLHAGWVWGLALLDSTELMSYTGQGSSWLKGLYNNPLAGLAGIICLLGTGFGLRLL